MDSNLTHLCKPGAISAAGASYSGIDAIAARVLRRMYGLHLFSPANVMKPPGIFGALAGQC